MAVRTAGPGATRQPPGEATCWLRGADVTGREQGANPHRHHRHNGSSEGLGRPLGSRAPLDHAPRREFSPFGAPESSVPPGTGAMPRHPARGPAPPYPPPWAGLAVSQRGYGLQASPFSGPPRGPRARRRAVPGVQPRLGRRCSAARAPNSGNYANVRDALPFDLNFLGMIPSHYRA